MSEKKLTSVRLSPEATTLRERLAAKHGISLAAVIEQALRRWADADGLRDPLTP